MSDNIIEKWAQSRNETSTEIAEALHQITNGNLRQMHSLWDDPSGDTIEETACILGVVTRIAWTFADDDKNELYWDGEKICR